MLGTGRMPVGMCLVSSALIFGADNVAHLCVFPLVQWLTSSKPQKCKNQRVGTAIGCASVSSWVSLGIKNAVEMYFEIQIVLCCEAKSFNQQAVD